MIVPLLPTGHDDTALLADALARAQPWTSLSLSGEFHVSGQLTLAKSNVHLEGHAARIVQHAENARTLVLQSVRNSRITGLNFLGRGTERPWANGSTMGNNVAAIAIIGSRQVAVEGCILENHAGGSILLDGLCEDVSLVRNWVAGAGRSAINPQDNGADGAIKSAANSIAKNGLTIQGNHLSGHCHGILIAGTCTMNICGNIISALGQHGMYITQGGDLVISGNDVLDCAGVGIKVQHQQPMDISPVLTITSNTIARCSLIGLAVGSAGAGVGYKTRNALVEANNVFASAIGMYFKDCAELLAIGNHMRECQRPLVRIDTTGHFADNEIAA